MPVITDETLMPALKPVDRILDDAAALLEEEGRWTKGEWWKPCELKPGEVSFCADGALVHASGVGVNFRFEDGELVHDTPSGARGEALERSYEQAFDYACTGARMVYAANADGHISGIINFNDLSSTTLTDVTAALRKGAELARAEAALVPVVAA